MAKKGLTQRIRGHFTEINLYTVYSKWLDVERRIEKKSN